MQYCRSLPFLFGILLYCTFYFPSFTAFLLWINLTLLLAQGLAQIYFGRKVRSLSPMPPVGTGPTKSPFISVHIPVCSEPPSVVCETIRRVVQQDYENFEVIVLDNNTADENLWKPVEAFCRNLPKVRFIRIARLEGFKAGALNTCLEYTDPKARFIFTVDADYKLRQNCLREAARAAQTWKTDMIQFPQAYWNTNRHNQGLQEEYRHYFNLYARGSNAQKAVLGTGTLTLLKVHTLRQLGGWPELSITEDAELGTRLQREGYTSVFVDHSQGYGMMPLDIKGLRKQRLRWVFGNMQTLIHHLSGIFRSGMPRVSSLLQLTAWVNLGGLPLLVLMVESLLYSTGAKGTDLYLIMLSLGSMWLWSFLKILLFNQTVPGPFHRSFQAFLSHAALMAEGAYGWWDALFRLKKPFVPTPKLALKNSLQGVPLIIPLLFTWTGSVLLIQEAYMLASLSLTLSGVFTLAVLLLCYQIRQSQRISNAIKPQIS